MAPLTEDPTPTITRTPWHCERCGARGTHEHPSTEKLMAIGRAIAMAHLEASATQRRPCSDARGVRVHTGQLRMRLTR